MAGNKFGVKFKYNSWTKHARDTKFVPESSLHSPASENHVFKAAFGHLHRGNYRQVTILRMFFKRMSNGIFVHSAVRKRNIKYARSNHPQINAGFLQILYHWKARLKGSRFILDMWQWLFCRRREWPESRANTVATKQRRGCVVKLSRNILPNNGWKQIRSWVWV